MWIAESSFSNSGDHFAVADKARAEFGDADKKFKDMENELR